MFSANSRAEKMPAGPAPTIITSNSKRHSPGDPKLHLKSAIYVLARGPIEDFPHSSEDTVGVADLTT